MAPASTWCSQPRVPQHPIGLSLWYPKATKAWNGPMEPFWLPPSQQMQFWLFGKGRFRYLGRGGRKP